MVCKKCNHKLPDDSTFCQYCGNKIVFDAPNNDLSSIMPSKKEKQKNKDYSINKNTSIGLAKYSVLCVIVPFILMIICLNTKSASSHTELLYIISMVLYVIICALPIISCKKNVTSIVLSNIPWLLSIGTIVPFFTEDIWNDGKYKYEIEVMLVITVLFLIVNLIVQLYFSITLNIYKYHTTASYKMKCYEKIDRINTLKEKGIISEDEFIKIKQQIIDKTV